MNSETIQALKDSIEHWKRMQANVRCGEEPSHSGCALCKLFYDINCDGCPVREKTESSFCYGTPYTQAWKAWKVASNSYADSQSIEIWKAVAQKEIDFLISLLPYESMTATQVNELQ